MGAGGGMLNWFCSESGAGAAPFGGAVGGWTNGLGRADGEGAARGAAEPFGGAKGLNWSSVGGAGVVGR